MRDVLVFAIVLFLLPTSIRRPFVGMLLFSWLAYMRPQDLCWGFARTMRMSFFVGVAMFLGWWASEQGRRRFEAAAGEGLLAEQSAQPRELKLQLVAKQRGSDLATIAQHPTRMPDPLPDLSARDLRRGSVFHQIVDRYAAVAAEPRSKVLHSYTHVLA
jgi:hypothetical protein